MRHKNCLRAKNCFSDCWVPKFLRPSSAEQSEHPLIPALKTGDGPRPGFVPVYIHRVSEKTVQIAFCQNFVKFPPILIIIGKKMTKRLKLCEMYSFFISINLHHHTTVLNADAPNCYTVLKVVSIRLLTHCIINSIEGATWLNNFVGLNIW